MMSRSQFVALSAFRTALAEFLRFSEKAAREAGITPRQYLLMLHVRASASAPTVGELARRLVASAHGTAALVTRSERAGLVRRRVSDTDRRCVELHLTARGERLVERVATRHRAELASLRNVFRVAGVS